MRRVRSSRPLPLLLVSLLWLLPAGCATVRLVGDYDQYVDQTATQLQKQMDGYLTKLGTLPEQDPARRFAPNSQFYVEYGVDVRSLATRVGAMPKNDIAREQLELMEKNVEQLLGAHRQQDNLSDAALMEYRNLFNTGWRAILTWELAKKR